MSAQVVVIGAGPAGLMAAECLARAGVAVDVYERMRTPGRKFLIAGRGGLNLTHSEPRPGFDARYGARQREIAALLDAFGPEAMRAWADELGAKPFVGSSGRVFPEAMKAAPLLRAWLERLREAGVRIHTRHRWTGWSADFSHLVFDTPEGAREVRADAIVLALGGGSWAKLGSDGAWVPLLAARGVEIAPLKPSNCGFEVRWSDRFRERYAGEPVKSVALRFGDTHLHSEFVISVYGVEGSGIYALSAPLRAAIEREGAAVLYVDLAPARSAEWLEAQIAHPRGSRSMASHLQSRIGLRGVKTALLRECLPAESFADPATLARGIKALPLRLVAPRPLDEAISSAGGVMFEAVDDRLMLHALPGVFCAGEMLDWEAPTGGYLLTACFASGKVAAEGVLAWLRERGRLAQ